jgi:excisionase family DNA binding protein
MTNPAQPSIEDLVRVLVRDEVQRELAKVPALQAPAASPFVSVAAYAKARSISVSTVRNAVREGRLPAMKIGSAVRVKSDAEIGTSVIPSVPHPGPSPAQVADRVLARRVKSSRSSVTSDGDNDRRRTARTYPSVRLAS